MSFVIYVVPPPVMCVIVAGLVCVKPPETEPAKPVTDEKQAA